MAMHKASKVMAGAPCQSVILKLEARSLFHSSIYQMRNINEIHQHQLKNEVSRKWNRQSHLNEVEKWNVVGNLEKPQEEARNPIDKEILTREDIPKRLWKATGEPSVQQVINIGESALRAAWPVKRRRGWL